MILSTVHHVGFFFVVVVNCRRTGALRPTCGPTGGGKRGGGVGGGASTAAGGRHKRRPPRGMYINHDDIAAMAGGAHGIQMLRAMDREIVSLRRQVRKIFYSNTLTQLYLSNAAHSNDSYPRN